MSHKQHSPVVDAGDRTREENSNLANEAQRLDLAMDELLLDAFALDDETRITAGSCLAIRHSAQADCGVLRLRLLKYRACSSPTSANPCAGKASFWRSAAGRFW